MPTGYVLAIDQGTTGSTTLVVDEGGRIVTRGYRELTQHYPQPGWVEHDPLEIWQVTLDAIGQAMQQADLGLRDIRAIGITNQRETTVVWDRTTGEPVMNAIVWQCRRTAPLCEEMKRAGLEPLVRSRTGLVIDAYFSATKLAWILDHAPDARARAQAGGMCFGTVDSWLIWKLTGGRVHVTDYSNASRTMLYDIHDLAWNAALLDYFGIPTPMLPQVRASSEVYGTTDAAVLGAEIPICGVAGDQQAALFGQTCFVPGSVKNTYGTGCFLLMNTGRRPVMSDHGLLTTIAWGLDNSVHYALEGSVFIAGAAVQWLRDELKVLDSAAESDWLASSIPDNGGVYLVPAFVGLGAPYWDMYARGTLVGLTRGSGRAHLARAALESIAYQTADVLDVMTAEGTVPLDALRVDGGASANRFLMQFQSDILGVSVERPAVTESTGLGAAFLAGLAVGYWSGLEELTAVRRVEHWFEPHMEAGERRRLIAGWKKAVSAARAFKD